MVDSRLIFEQCDNRLPGHGSTKSAKQALAELVEWMDGSEDLDYYGQGACISEFESEIATLFGKQSAVFMPSGTMAQQIALRIWCEQTGNLTVAMHPSSHLEFAEYQGYQFLHGIKRLQFGAPELLANRMLVANDFDMLGTDPGAIIIELPYRPLGGQLPPWKDLKEIREWAVARNIPMHLDGARIWQCPGYYQKTLAEIAELFDSVYLSFYKDLGGLCGSALIGKDRFIKSSRIWQRRYGGNLFTQAPFVISAQAGMRRSLAVIDDWVLKARELAGILSGFDGITVNPNPPHVNFFQLFVKGDADTLTRRHHALAAETGTFLFHSLMPSAVPGIAVTEIHVWENAMTFDVSRLVPFVESLLA